MGCSGPGHLLGGGPGIMPRHLSRDATAHRNPPLNGANTPALLATIGVAGQSRLARFQFRAQGQRKSGARMQGSMRGVHGAGLAMSHCLAARGRVAERRRGERRDSLRLLTPRLDEPPARPGLSRRRPRGGFMTMPDALAHPEGYAAAAAIAAGCPPRGPPHPTSPFPPARSRASPRAYSTRSRPRASCAGPPPSGSAARRGYRR